MKDSSINVKERRDALIGRREEARAEKGHSFLTTIKWPGKRTIARVRRTR